MTPNAEQNYRAQSTEHAKNCNTDIRQICCKCKKPRSVIGGKRKATGPGKISAWNPARFTCRECLV